MPEKQLWLIELTLPACATEAFMEGLEEFADSMSCFEDGSEEIWKLQIYTQEQPESVELDNSVNMLARQSNIDVPKFEISKVEIVDWVAQSQENFKSVEAEKFFVYPSWRKDEVQEGKLAIEIDPQQAFGTGGHETTKGCLLAMQHLPENDFVNILDMGCGSGILAIAAAKLWSEANIIAVDNDPICSDISKVNASLNNVAEHIKIAVSDGYNSDLVQNNAPYNLIISNILALPLIEFAPKASDALNDGGHIILAGLMIKQAEDVIAAHEKVGLELAVRQDIGDWSILMMRKTS